MPESDYGAELQGLGGCFSDFSGAYCTRKLVEMLLSAVFLLGGGIILGVFLHKYWLARPYWLISIVSLLLLSLIVNICFCFFNTHFWIYALESFLYSMYYLILVCYICYAYILKHTTLDKSDLMAQLDYNLNHQEPKNIHKIIFTIFVVIAILFYLAIFITSVVYQVKYDQDEFSADPNKNIRYCEETWYLVLNCICIVLSVVVVIIMLKSQNQEFQKLVEFNHEQSKREHGNITSSDGEQSYKMSAKSQKSYHHLSASLLENKKINNPFRQLWIWVGINVLSQILNLVQSGLLVKAKPPQCYLIESNPSSSNILSLVFVLLTMYMGYGATLWYICWVKIIHQKTFIDRTVLYSAQVSVEGNIELFVPSKEETITFQ